MTLYGINRTIHINYRNDYILELFKKDEIFRDVTVERWIEILKYPHELKCPIKEDKEFADWLKNIDDEKFVRCVNRLLDEADGKFLLHWFDDVHNHLPKEQIPHHRDHYFRIYEIGENIRTKDV